MVRWLSRLRAASALPDRSNSDPQHRCFIIDYPSRWRYCLAGALCQSDRLISGPMNPYYPPPQWWHLWPTGLCPCPGISPFTTAGEPGLTLSVTPQEAWRWVAQNFSATVSGNGAAEFHWDFGDGRQIDWSSDTQQSHSAPGHYQVVVTARRDAATLGNFERPTKP